MANFHNEQKQPNRKKYPKDSSKYDKTPRERNHDVIFPTHEGDLGVLNLGKGSPIPKQTRAPSRTGDGETNNVTMKMRNIMKAQGMLD